MTQRDGRSFFRMGGRRLFSALLCVAIPLSSTAEKLGAGNLLVAMGHQLFEYTRDGDRLHAVTVPYGAGKRPISESLRDLCLDGTRKLALYDGGFAPDLAVYDLETGEWFHDDGLSGWSSFNRFGGLACFDRWIFATDMRTGEGGEPAGILRFDARGEFTCVRFLGDTDTRDLAVTPNGRLFALLSETEVIELDAETMTRGPTLQLDRPCRAIGVDPEGALLGAGWDGSIHRFDTEGRSIASIETLVGNLNDLDVDEEGWIAAGSRIGVVVLVDPGWTSVMDFDVGEAPTFVAFVEAAD